MIAEADRNARQAGVDGRVSHQLGEASALPYPADYFDACRTERMLMHVADPAAVVAELCRVLKPGGWLALVEPDWGALSIATENADLERRLARIRAEQFLQNGYSGRLLYQLMRQEGFEEMSVEITPIWSNDLLQARYLIAQDQVEAFAIAKNLVSQEELEAWRLELQRAHGRGCFFASLNVVMVAGRKSSRK
jgi:SAM-dependent methyltransferase